MEIKKRNAIGALKLLSFVHGKVGEVVAETPDFAAREETGCSFWKIFGADTCHRISHSSMLGMCHAVNPKLPSRHEKMLAKGDECCRIVFEMQE